ncbi:hypothetical protein ABFV05_017298 [Capra hircus]
MSRSGPRSSSLRRALRFQVPPDRQLASSVLDNQERGDDAIGTSDHGQEQGREVSHTVTAQGSKLAQAQAPAPSPAAPFGAGAARPSTATWRRRDIARDTQTQTTRVPDPSSSLQPPAAAGPFPLRPLPARGPRSQGGCPGSDQRSGVAAGTSFCKEPRERLHPARPGGWTAVASSGSWRCPVGCAAPPPCKAPRSEPCSSWITHPGAPPPEPRSPALRASPAPDAPPSRRRRSARPCGRRGGRAGGRGGESAAGAAPGLSHTHEAADTAGAGGPVPPAPGSLFLSSPEPGLRSSNWDSEPGLFLALARLQEGIRICYQRRRRRRRRSQAGPQRPTPSLPAARSAHRRPAAELAMSESSSKSSQPLASKQEKDGAEKRGRGRPRKQPPKEPSEVPTPKRPRGRPKGSKNKGATKTRKTTTTPGRKPRGRPKKLEKEEEEGISQESSEEEQ